MIPWRPARFASLFTGFPTQRQFTTLTPNLRHVSKLTLSTGSKGARLNASIFTRGVRSYPRQNTTTQSSPFSGLVNAINRLPPTALVVGIIAVNGVVFMMWQGAKGEAVSKSFLCSHDQILLRLQRSGNWAEIKWMKETFLCSADNLRNGR